MEKYLVPVGIVAFIFLALVIAWKVYSRILSRKILKEGRNKKTFVFNYLSTRFSRLNTMRNVNLLVKDMSTPSGKSVENIGLVFVNRGGVVVINTVAGSGYVEVNERGKWNRIINDRYYSFDDPFLQNARGVKKMKQFLRDEEIVNVPVHNVVVFTGRVKFSKRIHGLITADELTEYIVDLNKYRILSKSEIKDVVKLIKYSRVEK